MAEDDLDALFGAFDGDDEDNNAAVEVPKVAAKSESDDEGKSSDDDEKQTSKKRKTEDNDDSDEEMDDTTKSKDDNKQSTKDQPKAKAVSTMYADVFSSMQHAVGHTQKKTVNGTNNSNDKDTKSNTDATNTDNTTNANDDDREVSTGTSHDKSIRSYSAIPDGPNIKTTTNKEDEDSSTLSTRPPAKTYPFTLDPFQQTAISYVEKNESVLVAAHTSAGKTVVAEYAIAKSLRDGQRVVYTSPIKALSNLIVQQFRISP